MRSMADPRCVKLERMLATLLADAAALELTGKSD
jgi:hypothetical protein